MKKRLAIVCLYCPKGKVYKYVRYLLGEIKTVSTDIYVCVNGNLDQNEKKKIEQYTNHIVVRENKGFDVSALKEMLNNKIGWEKVQLYDELFWVNDTFFGPFIPLENIFCEMESRKCDFWGLTSQEEYNGENRKIPFHIQSFFIVVRKKMLMSLYFRAYFESMPEIRYYREAVEQLELRFSNYFEQKGFCGDTYTHINQMYSSHFDERYLALMADPFSLIKEYGCPIVKKKCFTLNGDWSKYISMNEDIIKIMEYLKINTEYDTENIWECILDQYTLEQLDKALFFDYVVESKPEVGLEILRKSIVVIYWNTIEVENVVLDTVAHLGEDVEICLVTDFCLEENIENKIDYLEKKFDKMSWLQIEESNVTDVLFNATQEKWKDKEFICFIQDKEILEQYKNIKTARSLWCVYIENMLKSSVYIANICLHLNEEQRLGGVAVEYPFHANFNGEKQDSLKISNDELMYADELGISKTNLLGDRKIGTMFNFWIKVKCLQEIKNQLKEKSIPYLFTKNNLSTLMHMNGYYCQRVMSAEYTRLKLNYLRRMENRLFSNIPQARNEVDIDEYIRWNQIIRFSNRKDIRYIFGNGILAEKCYKKLCEYKINIEGFVITDKTKAPDKYMEKPILVLNDIRENVNEVEIFVAIEISGQKKVKEWLNENGIKEVFLYQ